jgi:hypothetical protein
MNNNNITMLQYNYRYHRNDNNFKLNNFNKYCVNYGISGAILHESSCNNFYLSFNCCNNTLRKISAIHIYIKQILIKCVFMMGHA